MTERDDAVEQGHIIPSERVVYVTPATQTAAKHVLGMMGGRDDPLGELPGSFTQDIIHAAMRADLTNRGKLRLGFPEYVRAVTLYKDAENGLDVLRAEAAGREYIP